jgi:hypothetical protein
MIVDIVFSLGITLKFYNYISNIMSRYYINNSNKSKSMLAFLPSVDYLITDILEL